MIKAKIFIVSAFFLGACSTIQAADLNGKWKITEIAGKSVSATTSVLKFDPKEQRFSAGVGCNHLFGSYRTDNNKLTLSNPATTLMGCPPELAELEKTLSQNLAQATSYQIQQNLLLIYDKKGNLIFQAER